MRALLRPSLRLLHDENGVALIEGAIISSFMVIVLLGMVELVTYFTTTVKVTEAADGIANIVTIEQGASQQTVDDLGVAIDNFLRPLTGSPPYAVAQVVYLDDGTPSLATADGGWVATRNGMTVNNEELLGLADGLGLPGEALVITRIRFPYSTMLRSAFSNTMPDVIVETAFAKPRSGKPILYQ
mgnify:CR=1 FL=1